MAKETGKFIIKSIYRWNNRIKCRKLITREKFLRFRSTTETSRSIIRKIQFIIFILVKKKFFGLNLCKKHCSEASRFKVGSSLSFSNLGVSHIIS